MGKSKTCMLVATTLAVAVAFLGVVASGCGKKRASLPAADLGSYTNVSYFPTFTNEPNKYVWHKLVSRLWLEGDGTWTANSPLSNRDGTTTPYYISGTYTVDGDKVRLSTSDGPIGTVVFSGRHKLLFTDTRVAFAKDSPDHPLPSPLPSNPPGPSPGPLIAHLSGDGSQRKVNDRSWTFPLTAGEEVALYYSATLMDPAHKSRISMYLVSEDGQVNLLLVAEAATYNGNEQLIRFQCTHTGDYRIKVTGYNIAYDFQLQ